MAAEPKNAISRILETAAENYPSTKKSDIRTALAKKLETRQKKEMGTRQLSYQESNYNKNYASKEKSISIFLITKKKISNKLSYSSSDYSRNGWAFRCRGLFPISFFLTFSEKVPESITFLLLENNPVWQNSGETI